MSRPCHVSRYAREDEHGNLNPFCVLALLGLLPLFALYVLIAHPSEDC